MGVRCRKMQKDMVNLQKTGTGFRGAYICLNGWCTSFLRAYICLYRRCSQGCREKSWGPGQNFLFWTYDVVVLNVCEAKVPSSVVTCKWVLTPTTFYFYVGSQIWDPSLGWVPGASYPLLSPSQRPWL